MSLDRRSLIAGGAAAVAGGAGAVRSAAAAPDARYGTLGRIKVVAGKRAALAELMLAASAAMPGCLSYVVAEDMADPDALWVTEVWDSKASHDASLAIPSVRAVIVKARPLIAGFDSGAETRVLGGVGLPR